MHRKLIDLEKDVIRRLQHKAIECGKDLKTYIQDELTKLANRRPKKNNPLDF